MRRLRRNVVGVAAFGLLAGSACDARLGNDFVRHFRSAPKAQPIPRNAPVIGDKKDEAAARLAWGRKQFLGSYDRVGLKDPKWDGAARRFIELSIPALVGGGDGTPPRDWMTAGQAVVALGCRDPLVLYLLGRATFEGTYDSADAQRFLAEAVEGMKAVPYPRAVARWAASALFGRYQWRGEPAPSVEALRLLEIEWFEQSLADGSYDPTDSLVLLFQLDNGTGPEFVARASFRVSQAIRRAPWVEPWVKLYFSGLRYHYEAWEARGGGWAKDVKPDEWRRFAEANARARHDLVEAWRLHPDQPQAACRMIDLVRDDSAPGESPRFWFDRTVAAELDYPTAYVRMFNSLLPRWGGSYEEMLSLGREALATGRFDTEVPLYALRAVTEVYDDQKAKEGGAGGTPIYEQADTYPMLVQTFEGYLKEPSQASRKRRYESLWAIVADRAGRPRDAFEHLKAADFRLTGEATGHLESETHDEFVKRISLSASPGAADAAHGDRLRAALDSIGALEAYRAALAKDPSPAFERAVRDRIASTEIERRLETGEWVPFLPASDAMEGWRSLVGTWKVEKDGALTGTAGARGLLLVSDARVGTRFEMKGRVEVVSSSDGFFQAGFAFGHPTWEEGKWSSFSIKRTSGAGPIAYFTHHFNDRQTNQPAMPVPDVNEVLIRVEDARLSAVLNGQAVPQGLPLTTGWDKIDPTSLAGFGSPPMGTHLLSLRFRDVLVRRLGK